MNRLNAAQIKVMTVLTTEQTLCQTPFAVTSHVTRVTFGTSYVTENTSR